ncbi:MAG: outer membrane beta-barrel protein [Gammaproteobacteria bacterium]|nr:outer membrane beta-barrel protein [Gammaproteobacteria bacterium]
MSNVKVSCKWLALVMLMGAGSVQAKPDFYFGAGYGSVDVDANLPRPYRIDVPVTASYQYSLDETDSTFKLFGGIDFNRYVGMEFGYLPLSEREFSSTETYFIFTDTYELKTEVQGIYITSVGKLPITDSFGFFGKLGLYVRHFSFEEKESSYTNGSFDSSYSFEKDETTAEPFFGVGMQLKMFTLSYERYSTNVDLSSTFEYEEDVDLVSVAVKF